MKTASPPDEMLREVDWKQVVFIVAGVPAPVLFSMGGISATIGAPAWLVWTISFILTALLTAPNHFTAVGDPKGGWFFLPHGNVGGTGRVILLLPPFAISTGKASLSG
jgi:hypothetical protein